MIKEAAVILLISVFLYSCTPSIAQVKIGDGQKEEVTEIAQLPSETIPSNLTSKNEAPNASPVDAPQEIPPPEEKVELTFEQAVWKKRIDAAMAPSYCPPIQKVVYPSSYYQGPLIDSHYHLVSLPDSLPGDEEGEEELYKQYYGQDYDYEDDEGDNAGDEEPYLGIDIKMSEIACTLQHEGTTKNFAFFPIRAEITPYALEMVKKTEEQYPDLFTPFTDLPLPPEDPYTKPEALSETLTAYPSLFQGWGEISLYVLKDGTGSYAPPDSALFTEIYPIVKMHKIMVYFHPGEHQRNNFERVLKQYPDINFIVHGDEIKDDISYLMGKYPNIFFTINNFYANQDIFLLPNGKKDFLAVFENYDSLIQKDLRAWEDLIKAHPDQVMWGLDRDEGVLWTFDRDVGLQLVDYARAFIGKLDPNVQEKFAYKNAERLVSEE